MVHGPQKYSKLGAYYEKQSLLAAREALTGHPESQQPRYEEAHKAEAGTIHD